MLDLLASMVVIKMSVHPLSLNYVNQRKAVTLRTRFSMSFSKIAQRVRNLKKRPSTKDVVRRVCEGFDVKPGCGSQDSEKKT